MSSTCLNCKGLIENCHSIMRGSIRADTISLSAVLQSPASFEVPSNVVAQVIHSSCGNASGGPALPYKIYVIINGQTNGYYSSSSYPYIIANPPTIVGPATITLVNTDTHSSLAVCTVQTFPASSTLNFTPSTAVVIPNDNGGPVTIILESSVDLANWTSALPGTYSTTSSNRFFRVRATR
jgi:hypothetical protein